MFFFLIFLFFKKNRHQSPCKEELIKPMRRASLYGIKKKQWKQFSDIPVSEQKSQITFLLLIFMLI